MHLLNWVTNSDHQQYTYSGHRHNEGVTYTVAFLKTKIYKGTWWYQERHYYSDIKEKAQNSSYEQESGLAKDLCLVPSRMAMTKDFEYSASCGLQLDSATDHKPSQLNPTPRLDAGTTPFPKYNSVTWTVRKDRLTWNVKYAKCTLVTIFVVSKWFISLCAVVLQHSADHILLVTAKQWIRGGQNQFVAF